MKKTLCLIVCLTVFAVTKSDAYEITVSSFAGLSAAVGSSADPENIINIDAQKITFTDSLNTDAKNIIFNTAQDDSVFDLSGYNISAIGADLKFNSNGITFQNGSSGSGFGGGISSEGAASLTFVGDAKFTGNIAASSGGAVYAGGGSEIIFNEKAIFSNNMSENVGGGIYAEAGSTVTFIGETDFIGNTAAKSGGAVYADNASILFNGKALFSENKTVERYYFGAAVFAANSNIMFGGETVFSDNTGDTGAGIYARDSIVTFGGETSFFNNIGRFGGGVDASDSNIFFNGNVSFANNTASYGGGVFAGSGSDITFTGEAYFFGNTTRDNAGGAAAVRANILFNNNAAFISNTSGIGGGVEIVRYSTVTFNKEAVFDGNSAIYGGGIIVWEFSNGTFNGKTDFSGNTATYGGGIFVSEASTVIFSKETEFTGNAASAFGGGIYAGSANISIKDAYFANNTAGDFGGAIYVSGSTVTITAEIKDVIFEGNTANGTANDIYMRGNSKISFNALNKDIILHGGIQYNTLTANNIVEKSGAETLYLCGNNNIEILDINEGSVNTVANSDVNIKTLTVSSGGGLNLSNKYQENINIETLTLDGHALVDYNDTINSRDAHIAGTIKVDFEHLRASHTGLYTVLQSVNAITGGGSLDLSGAGSDINRLTVTDTSGNNDFSYQIGIERLDSLSGLSSNQKKTAAALDEAFESATGKKLENINTIDGLSGSLKKDALSELSGTFIANVIKAGAANVGKRSLYAKIEDADNMNIWVQGIFGGLSYAEDENSKGDFEGSVFGAQAGWNLLKKENLGGGVYINYAGASYDQEDNSADMNEFAAGVYAGWFGEKWNFKGSLKAGMQSYETTREIKVISEKTEGSFDAFVFSIDAQALYPLIKKENFTVSPYGALEFGMVNYGSFDEDGLEGLSIDGGNYTRAKAEIGGQINGKTNKFGWYGDLGLGMLLTGAKGEFEGSYSGKNIEIEGAEQGSFIFNAAAGADYEITETIAVYAEIIFAMASDMNGYGGNMGVSYKIGKGK